MKPYYWKVIAMVIEITEYNYKGFHLQLVKGDGWKLVLDGEEILFPNAVAAEAAINEFYREVVTKHTGRLIE